MSSLAERLRGVIRPVSGGPAAFAEASAATQGPPLREPCDAAEILGGEWRESRGHRFLVIDRKYLPGYRHGRIAVADTLPPFEEPWPRLSLLAGATCGGRMLFVDLETTGLAGGAGTYAFLVGCGWFDGGVFRVRQYFLSSFAAERALLEAVAEAAEESGTVVTYNGKSFDVPLIDTRFQLHRMEAPFAGMPHVDMLHPARRLWRSDEGGDPLRGGVSGGGCRLGELEEALCGHTREGDVPGFEIPARYFHYVRSGDARGLEAVMEHNRLDLLSLALVTARASQLLEDGPAGVRTAREAFGIGRLYERGGLMGEARASFERAADMPGADVLTRAEALRASATLSRRERRYEDAATAWRRILGLRCCPPQIVREATEALAVHHEHRLRDPRAARGFALESMKLPTSRARQQALQHRLARLDRKLGEATHATLFTAT
jgi:uncharacterized protein YprB with RNaseH-like and TPR domain